MSVGTKILLPASKAAHRGTLIFLHGLGDSGQSWLELVKQTIQRPHLKYVFPTAPVQPVTLNQGLEMNAWFDVYGLSPNSETDERGIKASSDSLLKLVQDEVRNGTPVERIILGGFSQGGVIAMHAAMNASGSCRFAGLIALSTWMPMRQKFNEYLKEKEKKLDMPIFIGHGDYDDVILSKSANLSEQALKDSGFKNVELKIYKGMPHAVCEEEMTDVDQFIDKIFPEKSSN